MVPFNKIPLFSEKLITFIISFILLFLKVISVPKNVGPGKFFLGTIKIFLEASASYFYFIRFLLHHQVTLN